MYQIARPVVHQKLTASALTVLIALLALRSAVSHNMDIPGGAAYAQTHFERSLKTDPSHPAGNFQYGTFLGNAGRAKEALPYLFKAKDKGVVPALYAIGMSHLMLGDQALALENLQAYQKAVPGDAAVGKLIDAVRAGKVDVRKAGAR